MKRDSVVFVVTTVVEVEFNSKEALEDAIAALKRDGAPHEWSSSSVGWEATRLKKLATVRRARK